MDKTMSAEIRAFLKQVVVNQDGSLTFEGLLPFSVQRSGWLLRLDDRWHFEEPVLVIRRTGQHRIARKRGAGDVIPEDVGEGEHMRRGLDAVGVQLIQRRTVLQDTAELQGEALPFLIREFEARQPSHTVNDRRVDGHFTSPSSS